MSAAYTLLAAKPIAISLKDVGTRADCRDRKCPQERQEVLAISVVLWHNGVMARMKKAKREGVVAYIRMKAEDHERITRIADERGYPHTIASVSSEMISRGLASLVSTDREAETGRAKATR